MARGKSRRARKAAEQSAGGSKRGSRAGGEKRPAAPAGPARKRARPQKGPRRPPQGDESDGEICPAASAEGEALDGMARGADGKPIGMRQAVMALSSALRSLQHRVVAELQRLARRKLS